jgi:hypothetical protein
MPEFNSTQMAAVLAGAKIIGAEQGANVRRFFGRIVTPAGVVVNDTVYFGRLPRGSRIQRRSMTVSCSAGTASSVLDLGLRSTRTQVAIDADGLAVGIDIAAAGEKSPASSAIGALLLNGADDYVTTEEVDVYGTVRGANPPAGQSIVAELNYITD